MLPTEYNTKLYKEIQGDFVKTLEWDAAEHILLDKAIAQADFNKLVTSNLAGVRKIMFMIHSNSANQEQVYSASQISITNINIEINSKIYLIRILQHHKRLIDRFQRISMLMDRM